jgi:hypothetical protein
MSKSRKKSLTMVAALAAAYCVGCFSGWIYGTISFLNPQLELEAIMTAPTMTAPTVTAPTMTAQPSIQDNWLEKAPNLKDLDENAIKASKELCTSRLNSFDQTFDTRRNIRKAIVAEAKKENKDVYEFLWKPVKKGDTEEKRVKQKEMMKAQLFDLWEPEANCYTEERFGGESNERYNALGDGPKFICAVDTIHAKNPCLVYSIGSNNNILFETAVKTHLDCETHTFDPTLASKFIGEAYSTFHPWGLGTDGQKIAYKESSFTTMSLENMMKELGHTGRKIDVFKIDCERCEYTAMPLVFEAIARGDMQIDQILIELHSESYETITNFFEAADKAHMRVFHKERNGWGCRGTRCVEYAFISESFLREANAEVVCPQLLF